MRDSNGPQSRCNAIRAIIAAVCVGVMLDDAAGTWVADLVIVYATAGGHAT